MSLRVYYEVLNQRGTPALFTDTLANRPAFGFQGRLFISTDSGQIFEDTGTAWTLVADAGVGGGTLSSVCLNGNTTATGIVITAGGLSSTTGTFSGIVTAPQIKASTSGGLSINANSGTQVADFGAGGSANLTLYGGLSGTSASFSSSVTGNTIVKSGGTVNQFLKADGSVDSNSYFTTNTSETIAAGITKTFNNEMRFGLGTMYNNSTGVSLATGFTTINAALTGSNTSIQVWRNNGFRFTINCDLTTVGSSFVLPSGQTNALIATATGTSSQLIAGDGTLISAGTNITISGGTISSSGGVGITTLNTLTATTQTFATGTSGSDFNIVSATSTHTFNIPTASATNRGALSSADWTTFNNKQGTITLTTSGTSGPATLIANTLNIPQYSGGGMAIGGSITSATAGSVLFAGASGVLAQDNANFFWDDTNNRLGIGTATPSYGLHIIGTTAVNSLLNVTYSGFASVFLQAFNGIGYVGTFTNDVFAISTNNTERARFTTGGSFGIGTTTIGSTLQVNGNAAIGYSASTAAPTNGLAVSGNVTFGTNAVANTTSDLLTINKNQNAATRLIVSNTTSGTSSVAEMNISSSSGAGSFNIGKYSASTTAYKNFASNTAYLYNGTAGDIAFLNDFASGGFNISVGGSSTAQFILNSSGNLGLSTSTIGSKLQINGNAAIGYSASTAAPNNGLAVSGTALFGTSTDNGQGALQVTGGITANDISLTGAVYSSSATITRNYYSIFNGASGQTLTLPTPLSNNYQYVIINNTANTVTLAAATSCNIETTTGTSVASITLIANQRVFVIADGNNKYYQIF
jgi:hypothetical protein